MLTRKQQELLLFINQRLAQGGVSPSFEEMKDALDLKSKSGIHRLISGLEERGFIRRLPHRARALEVVRLPEETAVVQRRQPRIRADGPQQILSDGHSRRFQAAMPTIRQPANTNEAVEVEILGKIAAGTPMRRSRVTRTA